MHLHDNHPDLLTLACCYNMESEGAKILNGKDRVKVLSVDVTQRDSIDGLLECVEAIMKEDQCKLWALVNNAASLVFADAIWQTE